MGDMKHIVTSEEQFIAEMIPHHQEAIDTAQIIVDQSQDPEIIILAQAIVKDQTTEVVMLKSWLKQWYPDSTYVPTYKNMMRPFGKLAGHELEDQFMEDMIMHHEWAIQMAEQVFDVTQRPEIVQFANNVIATQSDEINQFSKLLDNNNRH